MGYGKMPIIRFTRVQSWTPARGATARYQAFDLQNVKIAPMNEFSTHHLDQSRQDDTRRQSQWSPVMHANQPYPVKLYQAITKAAYEMDEVENRSWLINLKATALYILLLSRDLGNYRPTRIQAPFRCSCGCPAYVLTKLDHIHILQGRNTSPR